MTNLASIYQSSDETIRAVWEFESSPLFSPAERTALRLGYRGALVPNEAGAEDFDELKKHFDEGQIVEIVATIVPFGYLNRWSDTMATTPRAAGRERGRAGDRWRRLGGGQAWS